MDGHPSFSDEDRNAMLAAAAQRESYHIYGKSITAHKVPSLSAVAVSSLSEAKIGG